MAGRSVLERHLVPGLAGTRRQGRHVADPRHVRSAHRASTCRVVTARRLEAVWFDLSPRCAEQASMSRASTLGGGVVVSWSRRGRVVVVVVVVVALVVASWSLL